MIEIVRAIYAPSGELILQRPIDKRFGGLWSIPGGKADEGETLDGALRCELREETSLEVGSIASYALAFGHGWSSPSTSNGSVRDQGEVLVLLSNL